MLVQNAADATWHAFYGRALTSEIAQLRIIFAHYSFLRPLHLPCLNPIRHPNSSTYPTAMAFITPLIFFQHSSSRVLVQPRSPSPSRFSSIIAATAVPPRVAPSPLPNLFIYDHCPFCVRVRLALGLKNIKHNLIWLANDDADTPTGLVGKKVVPIFQPYGSQGTSRKESLDIITDIDQDPHFGAPGLFKQATGRTDISQWFDAVAMPMRRLTRVRFARAPLPEFAFQEGRDVYVKNHPLKEPPTEYEENFNRSAEYIAEIQPRLEELAAMVCSEHHCSEPGLSYDDMDLFPRLRSMTIIKGLNLPRKLREYVEFQASRADIPLYDYCAM